MGTGQEYCCWTRTGEGQKNTGEKKKGGRSSYVVKARLLVFEIAVQFMDV